MQSSDYILQVWRFLRPCRTRLMQMLALTVGMSLLAMLPPLLVRAFIDQVISGGRHELMLPLSVALLLTPVLAAFAGFLQTQGVAYVGQRFVFDIRYALYQHLLRMSMRFFGRYSTGMLVNRLMGDTGSVANMLSAQTIGIVSDLVCSSFAVAVTFTINWRLAMVVALIIFVFVANYHYNIMRIRRTSRRYKQSFDRMSGGVQNRLVAGLTVKTFGTENREQDSFEEDSSESALLHQASGLAGNMFHQNTALIQNLGRAILYFMGCAMVLRGEMSYGDVLAFTTYAMQLLGPAVRFSELASRLQDVRISIERVMELYQQPVEVSDRPGARPLRRVSGLVEFHDVDFHYNKGQPIITGFNLRVEPGETIALVGPTGCGKSTLLLLLMRFFDVRGGRVCLDDRDVRDIRLHDLRAQFGVVLQEPMLFSVSIADNIRYARPRASQDQIEAAARVAEIHEFISSLPEGYATMLGSEGLQLSMGQKQRLTIARAVLTDPAIMIMDEATSALDSESERAIQLAMKRVLTKRTAFIVAHRLSTIREAHRILLIDAGRIIESGNHAQLMALENGRYRALYNRHLDTGVIDD
ncbi:MAG: ABC transporter ATP-binding protein [Kiritimatiellia bacterium]|nr:ABC transporter ATP-binding protein/permease [Lentisphaerota bacterium]